MSRAVASVALREHAPRNAMVDPAEIARFHDRCNELMRELFDELASAPERRRRFPEIEDAIGWPRPQDWFIWLIGQRAARARALVVGTTTC